MWACRPVSAEHLGGRRVRVTNRQAFASTRDLELRWLIAVDGVQHDRGTADVELAPGESKTITLPASGPRPAGEAHLILRWVTKSATSWADRGHEIAWEQFPLTDPVMPAPIRSGPAPMIEIGDTGIESIHVGGRHVADDITGCLWRAPVDNDGIRRGWMADVGTQRARWSALGLDDLGSVLDRVDRRRRAGHEVVTLHRRLVGTDAEAGHRTRITIADGHLRFDERIELPDDWHDLARVGVRFEAPATLDRLTWFGRGLRENYPDRNSSSPVHRFTSTVAEQYHEYVVPQEHGSHTDTRWFRLADARGHGFQVSAIGAPLIFAARHHHDLDLAAAATIADIDPAATIEVHIDTAMRGLGTKSCGPDTLPEYRLGAGTYTWSWALSG